METQVAQLQILLHSGFSTSVLLGYFGKFIKKTFTYYQVLILMFHNKSTMLPQFSPIFYTSQIFNFMVSKYTVYLSQKPVIGRSCITYHYVNSTSIPRFPSTPGIQKLLREESGNRHTAWVAGNMHLLPLPTTSHPHSHFLEKSQQGINKLK